MEENAEKVPDKIQPFVAFPPIIERLRRMTPLYIEYLEEKEK